MKVGKVGHSEVIREWEANEKMMPLKIRSCHLTTLEALWVLDVQTCDMLDAVGLECIPLCFFLPKGILICTAIQPLL